MYNLIRHLPSILKFSSSIAKSRASLSLSMMCCTSTGISSSYEEGVSPQSPEAATPITGNEFEGVAAWNE